MLQLILGHHKCGTLWIHRLLKQLFPQKFTAEGKRSYGQNILGFLEKTRLKSAFIIHSKFDDLHGDHDYKAVHIIRDPRDVAVSAYFSHRYSHGIDRWDELANHRLRLANMSHEDGLIEDLRWSDNMPIGGYGAYTVSVLRDMEFPTKPNILTVRFEDLVSDTYQQFQRAIQFLELDEPSNLAEVVEASTWSKLTGRKPGDIKQDAHMRSGKPGDWKNHFTPKVEAYFESRFGNLASRLGYQNS